MRLLLTSISLLLLMVGHGQYYQKEKSGLYFFGVNHGVGVNKWYSEASSYKLWAPDGHQIINGDSHIRARTFSELYEIHVLLPVKNLRVGFGMNFEIFTLEELELDGNSKAGSYGFQEVFRYDKLFLQVEKGVWQSPSEKLEWFVNGKIGTYAFSMVNSTSLFGESRWGKMWFTQIKSGLDLQVFNMVYINLNLLLDYKFFRNSKRELPRNIRHNIFTAALTGGIRLAFR